MRSESDSATKIYVDARLDREAVTEMHRQLCAPAGWVSSLSATYSESAASEGIPSANLQHCSAMTCQPIILTNMVGS